MEDLVSIRSRVTPHAEQHVGRRIVGLGGQHADLDHGRFGTLQEISTAPVVGGRRGRRRDGGRRQRGR